MARLLIGHLDPVLAALPMADGSPVLPIRRWTPRLRRRPRASPAFEADSVGLRTDPGVGAIVDPKSMLTAELYDPQSLARFVTASLEPGFADASRFGRLLTLELVARSVGSV
jgi:hypothetical protein